MNSKVKKEGFLYLCRKHKKFIVALAVLVILFLVLLIFGSRLEAFHPQNAKDFILKFGTVSPVIFILLQIMQIVFAPIPGQATGFAGGYVFGWKSGIIYTMTGLGLGSLLIFILARKLGRPFVEKFNASEAVRDFEKLFIREKSKIGQGLEQVKKHGLLTFFIIMLLPAVPDDVACFAAGLSLIPIWQLVVVTLLGRFPGMLVLNLVGDGVSRDKLNTIYIVFIAFWIVVTVIYLWKKKSIENYMINIAKRISGKKR